VNISLKHAFSNSAIPWLWDIVFPPLYFSGTVDGVLSSLLLSLLLLLLLLLSPMLLLLLDSSRTCSSSLLAPTWPETRPRPSQGTYQPRPAGWVCSPSAAAHPMLMTMWVLVMDSSLCASPFLHPGKAKTKSAAAYPVSSPPVSALGSA
jgi:hypothetical protein